MTLLLEEPDDAMPTAKPICMLNHFGISDMVGTVSMLAAMPTQKACASKA